MPLTEQGFVVQRLNEIKADYDQRFNDALGPVNTNPDAVVGQLVGIFSEALSSIQEVLQDTYDSMYPSTAEGISLDNAVSFVGLERLDASTTIVTGVAYGTQNTVIPAGSLASADIQYASTSDITISRANALDVTIEVQTVSASALYTSLIGGETVAFTSSATPSKTNILTGIAALLNPSRFISSVANEKLRIYSLDKITPFTVTLDPKLVITKIGSPVIFAATTTGANVVPVGALNKIDTPILGWDSVSNLAPGDQGRDVESDAELRLRHASSVRAVGSATVEAIKARMLAEVDGVTSVQVYENRTNIESADGIPPHAFETVVIGGTNSEIANQLWLTKPAGIETHGNQSVTIIDSNGDGQLIKFSRATDKYIWVRVTVELLNDEEQLPTTAEALIKQAVLDYALANIGVGDDVITQRFYGPIYARVPGLGRLLVETALTIAEFGTPIYSEDNIIISKSEAPAFSIDRISVIGI